MTFTLDRRRALLLGAGTVAALAAGGPPRPAFAANDAAELIARFTGGKPPAEGRIALDLPEIAENGNTVPMAIKVDSPMTEDQHVTEVLVVADRNPRGAVATFRFSPASGVAEVSTRIRLSGTQTVTALAKMNDGSCVMARREIMVTIGGCGS